MRRLLLPTVLPLCLLVVACGDKGSVTSKSATQITAAPDNSTPDATTPSSDTTSATPASTDTTVETTVDTTVDTTPDTTPDTAATTPTSSAPDTSAFDWTDYGSDSTIQTGSLKVPIDYQDPSKGTFDLYVTRHQAAKPGERIGSLLVNPGGPGFGGSDFAIYADQIYGQGLLDKFDIVAWDPRGTGLTEPKIDCISDYDKFFASTDITPDDSAERQTIVDLAKKFADDCVSKNAAYFPYVGTNNSARDMDSIRQALGEAKISYFGFSYGSELGATWSTLFPTTVRAAVLDGAADPTADLLTSGLQQAAGFEGTIKTFLDTCSKTKDCAFNNNGDAGGAFDKLMLSLDDKAIPSDPGRPDVTRGVALTAVAEAMYSKSSWPELEQALADAQAGKGSGLLALYDSYFQRKSDGTYDNSLEAFQVISCMDSPDRPTVAEDDATAPQLNKAAPRFAPGTTGSYFCTFFPAPLDPRVPITGKGAGPILVMGTTGDPATPLTSTQNMAKTLEDGRLVIVTADQHTGYGVNDCSKKTVDDYLINPAKNAPENGKRCD